MLLRNTTEHENGLSAVPLGGRRPFAQESKGPTALSDRDHPYHSSDRGDFYGSRCLIYLWLADLVVAVHLAYAAFVALGLLAILVGVFVPWPWVRNFKFRTCHLIFTALVAVESFWGVTCPLTALENLLLQQGGRSVGHRTFVGRWMNQLLFYDAPEELFTVLYASLALLTIGLYTHLFLDQRHSGKTTCSASL
jgi:uncharacterized protein DUF2784